MPSTVEQVKAKLGIVEVVSGYLKLEKAGTNWKARCPFHNERTPSFFVSPTRQSYHCFGCNRGGDIISFIEEIEGLDFLGSLKMLAERAGVQLEPLQGKQENSEKELLFRVLEAARDYYAGELKLFRPAQDYLHGRGLTAETINVFQLGFVPAGWDNLCQFLATRHFSDELIIKAGLALRSTKNDGLYDRFRSRLMFPLNDAAGRVVGFSGRVFGPEDAQSGGKYVNSPETPVYSKSKILYGYDRAKVAARRADQCIIVEGQLDLLLSHQAGFAQTVAVSGTALTVEHLTLIRRLTENLTLAFDGDSAGLAAANRSIGLALGAGFNVRLVPLANGEDPAALIARDPKAWTKALADAKPVIDFLLANLVERESDKLKLIHGIEKTVYPYLAVLPNSHDRDYYIAKIALLTQLSENGIREKLQSRAPAPQSPSHPTVKSPTRREKILAQLFAICWWREEERAVGRLREFLENDFVKQEAVFLPRRNELTLNAELTYAGITSEKLEREFTELLNNLKLDLWQSEIEDLRFCLSRAEREKKESEVQAFLARLQSLYQKVSNLKTGKQYG